MFTCYWSERNILILFDPRWTAQMVWIYRVFQEAAQLQPLVQT